MNLPDLPQQNKKLEAFFGIDLKHWVEKNLPPTCSIETKHTHSKEYLLYSEVKKEQLVFGLAISSNKGAWIRVQGLNGEPDYIWMRNEIAFIVIKYPKGFCFITVGNFMFEKEKNKRKSLTWERACEIAYKTVKLVNTQTSSK